jgi:hypothetical protein
MALEPRGSHVGPNGVRPLSCIDHLRSASHGPRLANADGVIVGPNGIRPGPSAARPYNRWEHHSALPLSPVQLNSYRHVKVVSESPGSEASATIPGHAT